MKLTARCLLLSLCFSAIVGCGRDVKPSAPSDEAPADAGPLVIYNWEEYLGSDTVANFTEETGIEVIEIFFEEEEEMLGALQSGAEEFDLVVASDDAVREMIEGKMLRTIDFGMIPNFKHIAAEFRNQPWDSEQLYSIPYMWGTTGIVVNTQFVEAAESYSVVYDTQYAGKIAMLSDPWEVAAAAAKSLGYSIVSRQEDEWTKIAETMLAQRELLHGYYDALTIQQMLIDEEIYVGQIYSGEGLSAVDENENLAFIIPEEGASQWVDLFVIPRTATHIDEAHRFLDFILEPEVNAAIASEHWYATANGAAEQYMDPEVLEDSSVYPSDAIRENLEFFEDVGTMDRIVNRAWSEIRLDE